MTSPAAQTEVEQLLSLLRERQGEWRQRYQVQRIGLFGSTARNQAGITPIQWTGVRAPRG